MKPVTVEQRRFEQPRAVMMLDDAEMALTMIDLAETTTLSDVRPAPARQPAKSVQYADAVAEFRSAARMIMSDEEIEVAVRELEQELRHHYPSAA